MARSAGIGKTRLDDRVVAPRRWRSRTPALVGRDANRDYRAYAAPDVDDPNWTFLGRVKFDLALGAMPTGESEIRALTLAEVLAEAPSEHHAWIRGATEAIFERQLECLCANGHSRYSSDPARTHSPDGLVSTHR